jgi:hypothetical protein
METDISEGMGFGLTFSWKACRALVERFAEMGLYIAYDLSRPPI